MKKFFFRTYSSFSEKYSFFFDMDGTLFNTEKVVLQAHTATLKTFGFNKILSEEALLRKVVCGKTVRQAVQGVKHLFPEIKMRETEYENLLKTNYALIKQRLPESEYFIAPTINLLKSILLHRLKVCIVSNSTRQEIEENLGLLKLPSPLPCIGYPVYSKSKPHPEPYLKAALVLGVVPNRQCIVFEDSENGICSAKSAGMFVVGVAICQTVNTLLCWGADVALTTEQFDIKHLYQLLSNQGSPLFTPYDANVNRKR